MARVTRERKGEGGLGPDDQVGSADCRGEVSEEREVLSRASRVVLLADADVGLHDPHLDVRSLGPRRIH